MKVWIRGRSASRIAFQAASMSALWVRANPQITGPSTVREIASTASKSPGEVIGKPASITSTPSRPSCWAISTFSWVLSEIPGDCSPSRRVVSKMRTWLAGSMEPMRPKLAQRQSGVSTTLPTLRRSAMKRCASGARSKGKASATTGA